MKKVLKFQIQNGEEFNTQKEAERHIEKLYGDELTRIAHKLVQISKYVGVCEFIDTELSRFQYLIDLKKDLELQTPDEE